MMFQWEVRIFLSVLFVVIVIGNLTVLLAIGLSKRGVSSRMNFFILHMAIAGGWGVHVRACRLNARWCWRVHLETRHRVVFVGGVRNWHIVC